ncbi:DUF2064 domain-containing protein [uncultured Dokdonia sp.]|uniref:TIGR04282 family arsenosugar biosynthesis glycosyltransferase n=1 Tax=uncultured Dokdonia sp. TaxID=575653 RepID=UPI002626DADD|nr:DUF2064 domain-containing protein [uncultured Dokdonia sp.]
MKKTNLDTAILVFALSPEAEKVRKPFFALEKLGSLLQKDTLKKVQETGFDYYHFDESLQEGATFGERISQAAQTIFNKGYHQLLIIGNDTPSLTSQILKKAALAICDQRGVAGLSKDGGLYLIGLSRKHFDKKSFKELAWQTKNLRNTFLESLSSKNISTVCLPILNDIDNFKDLYTIQYKPLGSILECIRAILRKLENNEKISCSNNKLLIRFVCQTILGTRGSPATFFLQ